MSESYTPARRHGQAPRATTSYPHAAIVALGATAVSFTGLMLLLFTSGVGGAAWLAWFAGAFVAFVAGAVAWEHGRLNDSRRARLAAQVTLGYLLAVTVFAVVASQW